MGAWSNATLSDKKPTKAIDDKNTTGLNVSPKPLTATDGSVLAIIAQTPNLSDEKLNALLVRASPNAQEIAQKMIKLRQTKDEKKLENKESEDENADSVHFIADHSLYNFSLADQEKTSKQRASAKDATTLTAQAILHWARMNKTARK
jgi:hypothetical protein